MTLIKILGLIFTTFATSRVVLRYKGKQIGYGTFIFWLIIWFGTLFFVFYPNISDKFAQEIGISSGVDTLFFIAIIVNFYLIFKIYVKSNELDQRLTKFNSFVSIKFTENSKKRQRKILKKR